MVIQQKEKGKLLALMLVTTDCRCFDIFTPEEQKILKKYRQENFAEKRLVYSERRAIGKCPLTPEEVNFVSLILL